MTDPVCPQCKGTGSHMSREGHAMVDCLHPSHFKFPEQRGRTIVSDPEAVIRKILRGIAYPGSIAGTIEKKARGLAALDVLVVEKDTFRQVAAHHRERVAVLEAALTDARDPAVLAKRFHEKYELLAPEFGYETRKESAVPWEEVPQANRQLMVAVCAALIEDDRRAALSAGCVPACKRCNDSGVVASVDGEAMDCQDCEAGCVPKETPDE